MLIIILLFLCVGVLAGLSAGLFGVGGGSVIVPLSLMIFTQVLNPSLSLDVAMLLAIGTSIATIPLTGASAVYRHIQLKSLDWRLVGLMLPGMMLGGLLGSLIAPKLGGEILQKAFGVFQLVVGWRMFRSTQVQQSNALDGESSNKNPRQSSFQEIKQWIIFIVSLLIGIISAIFGIGGGTLTVPFLLMSGYKVTQSIAVSSAAGVFMALTASLGFALFGTPSTELIGVNQPHFFFTEGLMIGSIFWPGVLSILATSLLFSRLGVNLAHKLSVQKFKRLLSICLICVGGIFIV